MDPVKAGLSLYEAGGLALLLLALMAALIWMVGRFLFKMVDKLGDRINDLEGAQRDRLDKVMSANTTVLGQLVVATSEQTIYIKQQTEALRQRPCLIESGIQPRPTLARG